MKFTKSTFDGGNHITDGNRYEDCTFVNCTLEYSGGKPPDFIDCNLIGSNFAFTESAGNTLSFLAAMYHGGFRVVVDDTFESIRNMVPSKKELV